MKVKPAYTSVKGAVIMSAEVQAVQEPKQNDKEFNFRQMEKRLNEERSAREQAERELQRLKSQSQDEDNDSEPYVDHKKLTKTLSKFGENTESKIEKGMEMAKERAKKELKQEMWLDNNPDFHDVLQHAEKFYQKAPHLAETILHMPEGFERQKLVYQNIKALGIDKPETKQPSVQEKIDANRRSPFYQPSGIAPAPYAAAGDFSAAGQKNAYAHMQDLKNRLRLG